MTAMSRELSPGTDARLREFARRVAERQSSEADIQQEIHAHLEDATFTLMDEDGLPENEAATRTISRFGDTEQVAGALAGVHGGRIIWPRLLTAMALFVAVHYAWVLVSWPLPRGRFLSLATLAILVLVQVEVFRRWWRLCDSGKQPPLLGGGPLAWAIIGTAWLALPLVWWSFPVLHFPYSPPFGGETLFPPILYQAAGMLWYRFCGLDGLRGLSVWLALAIAPTVIASATHPNPSFGSPFSQIVVEAAGVACFAAVGWLCAWDVVSRRKNAVPLSIRKPAGG
jgi:hypothetical protein